MDENLRWKGLGLLLLGTVALLLAVVVPAVVLAPVPAGAAPGSCSEQVNNGGFEDGEEPWIYVPSPAPTPVTFRTTFETHSGTYAALLGGRDDADDRLSQVVVLPAGSGSLMFSFWWTRYTEEPRDPGWSRDFMYVELYSADGSALIAQLFTFDNTDGIDDLVWNPISVDLQQYAGQTVQLRYRVTTDLNLLTRFFIDDVSIQAGTTCPTPMPTVTLTFTPTSTPTPRSRIYLPLVLRSG